MPKLNQSIEVTDTFNNLNIDELTIQPASMFLLKCMKDIPKINNIFLYDTLLNFMIYNSNNKYYYNGTYSLKNNNIKEYWRYSKSNLHSASIPNFNTYYNYIN
jgi:hypothetical protein